MARYEGRGNTYPVKDLFKLNGFSWWAKNKTWVRHDKTFDVCGDTTDVAVMNLRKALKERGSDVEVVFIGDSFTPGEEAGDIK